ncbi:WAS/WASL-interacting protein family member 1-like [Apodemus sylvaticus]|uniref:WAS/WASL-interacting protein family member 1-like n=1 Tax=Apodemus sylvaticus TaxID=10129 RepID=UPI002243D0D3|nr:WAS/WASL-interacting protein family member 1-like [Apodemus sylvaticus]
MSSDALHPAVPALTWVPPLSPPGLVAAWPDSPGLLPPPCLLPTPGQGATLPEGALCLPRGRQPQGPWTLDNLSFHSGHFQASSHRTLPQASAKGAGGGNRRSSFPTLSCASGDGDQRSCCALRCALPPLAALRGAAPSLVPRSWLTGSAPHFQARPPSPAPRPFPPLSHLRPGARAPPGPDPSFPSGTPAP